MSFSPDLIASLDEEVRAFIHMSGIEFMVNIRGELDPIIRRGAIQWVLHRHYGHTNTVEYWRDMALRAYKYLPPFEGS